MGASVKNVKNQTFEGEKVDAESNRGEEIETCPRINFSLETYLSCKEVYPKSGFNLEGENLRLCYYYGARLVLGLVVKQLKAESGPKSMHLGLAKWLLYGRLVVGVEEVVESHHCRQCD